MVDLSYDGGQSSLAGGKRGGTPHRRAPRKHTLIVCLALCKRGRFIATLFQNGAQQSGFETCFSPVAPLQ